MRASGVFLLVVFLLPSFVASAGATDAAWMHDEADVSGIGFTHAGAYVGIVRFPDSTAGGACWGDYDNDGWLDLYVTDTLTADEEPEGSRLYRNAYWVDGDNGTRHRWFEDRTDETGASFVGFANGCLWGDFDNDGWQDLFIAAIQTPYSMEGNRLYRNLGVGFGEHLGFEDVTEVSRITGDTNDPFADHACQTVTETDEGEFVNLCYSVSAAWLDFDLDGDLDLYVGNYAELDVGRCKSTIGPDPENCIGQHNRLWRNDADGTFTEVGLEAGVAANEAKSIGRTLGVVATDIDGDAWPDIYVTNDMDENALYLNDGEGGFVDVAVERGASGFGPTEHQGMRERAGMGLDASDVNDDGLIDLVSTHLWGQDDAFLLGKMGDDGVLVWEDVAPHDDALGVLPEAPSRWGGGFIDLDLDGRKDYFVVSGGEVNHEAGPIMVFQQTADGWRELGAPDWVYGRDVDAGWRNMRSAVWADHDNDGDLDLAVGTLDVTQDPHGDHSFRLFRSYVKERALGAGVHTDGAGEAVAGNHVRVALVGTDSARDAIGARIIVETDDGETRYDVRRSGGYLGNSDPRTIIGIGEAKSGQVTIRWPGGHEQGPVPFTIDEATGGAEVVVVEENLRPIANFGWISPPEVIAIGDRMGIRATWSPTFAADFAGFEVRHGAEGPSERVRIDDRHVTEWELASGDFSGSEPWYVEVVAIDAAGHEASTGGVWLNVDEGGAPGLPGVAVLLVALALVVAGRRR